MGLRGDIVAMDARSIDRVLRALAAFRRRAVCRYFLDSAVERVRLPTLVDAVVRREQQVVSQQPENHRQVVEADLHHVHLPTLASAEVVEFEAGRGRVRYLGHALVSDLLSVIGDPASATA